MEAINRKKILYIDDYVVGIRSIAITITIATDITINYY